MDLGDGAGREGEAGNRQDVKIIVTIIVGFVSPNS